jgi:hypothetical protein
MAAAFLKKYSVVNNISYYFFLKGKNKSEINANFCQKCLLIGIILAFPHAASLHKIKHLLANASLM